jgi:MFS family permease
MTIVGEMYALEERAKSQALFSGVWGVASVIGPLVGGYVTDALSWRWVFYLNLPFGLLALTVIVLAYPPPARTPAVRVDWLGAFLLFAGTSALLIALGGETNARALWFAASAALLVMFIAVERRTADPILPVDLFSNAIVARTSAVVFLTGTAMFGAIAFIPLFVQAVMGGTATQAGQVLTPLFLGWVAMSITGAKLTVKLGYRPVAITGAALLTIAFIALSSLDSSSARRTLLIDNLILGGGMGLSMLSLLLAVQHGVERSRLGIATSLNQFSRSIGAAVGVAAMGALMTRGLSGAQLPGGVDIIASSASLKLTGAAREQFAGALHQVFLAGAFTAGAAFLLALFLPAVDFSSSTKTAAGEQMLAAEMTNLEAEDEPIAVGD